MNNKILLGVGVLTAVGLGACGAPPSPSPVPPEPTPTAIVSALPSPTPSPAPTQAYSYKVTVWAPYASILERQTLSQYNDLIQEVNFFWYELAGDGSIAGAVQSPVALREAREAGLGIVPSIVNGDFDRQRVATLIADPIRRAQHIQDIVDLVRENEFDGIDIDYESLHAEDRDAFSLFIEELALALHAENKLLSIAVHPKVDEQGPWGGPLAQDWGRIGAAVDEFKIMTYDYHNGASEAGSIAPLEWVDAVLTYAATQVPPAKTYLGVPFYGYNWTGSSGEAIDWRQAVKLAANHGAEIQRDESGEAWFSYGPENRHTVHFADAQGVATRVTTLLEQHPDLAGIAIWRLGNEDPGNWPMLQEILLKGSE